MNNTRFAVWISVVALAVATLSYRATTQGQPEQKATKVLFIGGGDTPFWQLSAAGAEQAAKQYNSEIQIELPKGGPEVQSQVIEGFSPEEYNGIVISPQAPEQQSELLSRVAKDSLLVTFDSDAPLSDRLCYVGTDNYSAGRLVARLVKKAAPNGGKVAFLVANFEKDNAVLRVQGFQEEMQRISGIYQEEEQPSYEILEPLIDGIDRKRCIQNVKQALKEHPDLAVFVGLFSYHGPVLLEVMEELESESGPKLVVFDEEEAVLKGIEQGSVFATVVQDPFKYGYESVRMIAALHGGRMMELPISGSGSLFLPCEPITAENVGAFRQRLADRLTD